MNLSELKKLSRNEMKAIMAGSGGAGCRTLGQSCGGGSGITYCCNGLWCNSQYHKCFP